MAELQPRVEETATDIVAEYEAKGFCGQFGSRPGGRIFCSTCRKESDAGRVSLMALHRLEGVSDPSEEQAVAALECPLCGARGTAVLSYGPTASPEDALALARLPDRRGRSGIRSGM